MAIFNSFCILAAFTPAVCNPDFRDLADYISAQRVPANENDVYITLIICATVVVCLMLVSVAAAYCIRKAYNAKLKEQEARLQFEKDRVEQDNKALKEKWEHEKKVREEQWEHDEKKAVSK